MEKPQFKYSPNAYSINVFKEEKGVCSVCNKGREIKYTGSFYSVESPSYICPWCIADGSTAEKYKGDFNDYLGIEGVSPDPADPPPEIEMNLLLEITDKTPSYVSWQQEVWLTHCKEPCAFIGYVDAETIKPLLEELKDDIEGGIGMNAEYLKENLTQDGHLVGYLFQCLKCGQHRLHADCD